MPLPTTYLFPDGTTIKRGALAGVVQSMNALTTMSYKLYKAAIANGASLSDFVDIEATRLYAIKMDPRAWTSAALTFQVSVDGTNFYSLFDSSGTEDSWTVAAAMTVVNASPAQWLGVRYLKIRSGTSASPVNQGGARTLTIIGVPSWTAANFSPALPRLSHRSYPSPKRMRARSGRMESP